MDSRPVTGMSAGTSYIPSKEIRSETVPESKAEDTVSIEGRAPKAAENPSTWTESVSDAAESSSTRTAGIPLVNLNIIHTNDIHGHTEPFEEGGKTFGGIAQIAKMVDEERKIDPAHTLLIDGGDMTFGAPLSDYFKGRPIVDAMNRMGYDAAAMGNHDFDDRVNQLAQRLKDTEFPVLAANLVLKDADSPLQGATKPYLIKEMDGLKMGIVGLVTPDSLEIYKGREDLQGIEIAPAASTLEKLLPELRKKGADIIILVSHLGVDKDKEIAARFQDINLIIGAHSHTQIDSPLQVGKTLIMQTGCYGKNIGKAHLSIDREDKRVRLTDYELIPVESGKTQPDPEIAGIIKKYEDEMGAAMGEVIGALDADLIQRDYHLYREESNLGDFLADIIRKRTKADIGFINASGIRSNLYKGKLKVGDFYTLHPWEGPLSTVTLKGKYIPRLLEDGMKKLSAGFAISGLRVEADTSRPEDHQVVSITDESGKPLDPEKEYSIATRACITQGFIGFESMKKAKGRKDWGDFRDSIIDEVRGMKEIKTGMDGRIKNRAGS